MDIRKLPTGIQSFKVLRQENYLYVDKTKYIWDLLQKGSVYFLSRPRRFGKSLLVSTMEAYFQGEKDLFHGLAIEKMENNKGKDAWISYPVFTFSLSGGNYHAADGLSQRLDLILSRYELRYGADPAGRDLPNRFANLIETAFEKTGRPVVVLVDEYDKPLLETMISDKEQERRNRQLYKSFFSILKDEGQYLKFIFFTGVTKFGKISVFSDLNQLRDLSLTEEAAGICGISEEELLDNFKPEIIEMAKAQGFSKKECIRRLKEMYDGYRFSGNGIAVYNPFSLLNAFQDRKFRRYWFSTGTPTFLVQKLRHSPFTPEQFSEGIQADESSLMDYYAENPDPVPLFYQSGYLTISGFDRRFRLYDLEFPNQEVKFGFLESLVPYVLGYIDSENPLSLRNMVLDLEKGDADSFLVRLKVLFASIPYPEGIVPHYEREWRNQIFLILTLLGQYVKCEVHTASGRADCITETEKYVYIFEYKLDKSAESALEQIEEKGYAVPYLADSRKIIKTGISFSTDKRNIAEWKSVS